MVVGHWVLSANILHFCEKGPPPPFFFSCVNADSRAVVVYSLLGFVVGYMKRLLKKLNEFAIWRGNNNSTWGICIHFQIKKQWLAIEQVQKFVLKLKEYKFHDQIISIRHLLLNFSKFVHVYIHVRVCTQKCTW